ncbi:MAG TPA: hypothetical protein V6C81_23020 [Planktothrix sp.]|jgi:hypothetical protein
MDTYKNTMRRKMRSRQAQSIAELPMGLWFLLIGFFIPLLGLATFGYKIAQVYWATKDAAYVASVTSTYDPSTGPPACVGMKVAADNVFANDMAGFNATGAIGTHTLQILQKTVGSTGAPVIVTPPLAKGSLNVTTYIYFARYVTVSNIPPFLGSGWKYAWFPAIAGLNAPLTVQLSYDDYVENPNGLTI